jgi:hypothetical protein
MPVGGAVVAWPRRAELGETYSPGPFGRDLHLKAVARRAVKEFEAAAQLSVLLVAGHRRLGRLWPFLAGRDSAWHASAGCARASKGPTRLAIHRRRSNSTQPGALPGVNGSFRFIKSEFSGLSCYL